MKRECHPVLRGGRRGSRNTTDPLPSAEMESLTSICEAFFPPLQLEHLDKHNSKTKAVQHFWKSSASQFPIPQEVPLLHFHIFCAYLFPSIKFLIKLYILFSFSLYQVFHDN